jgi:urea transporter/murein DD-endopeptidase MepM/ murein hydrolase activator NlpD
VNRLRGIAQEGEPVLLSYAGVLFCGHPVAGLAILAVTFIRPEVGVAGMIAAAAALLVSRAARYGTAEERAAVCNALLVGLAVGFAQQPSWTALAMALAGGALTALAAAILAGWLYRLNHLPALSLAFVLMAWLLIAVSRDVAGLQPAPPVLYWHVSPRWLNDFLVSLGWFLFTPDPIAGAIMFAVLLWTSRYLALLAVAGYACGAATLLLLGSTIQPHLVGFNFVLAAVATGGIYSFPDRVSFLWAMLAAVAAALFCIGLPAVLGRLGLPPLALPFLLATWLVLGAFAGRSQARPFLMLENPTLPEKNLLAARLVRARLIEPGSYPVGLPFSGDWKVSQSFDGPHTHRGPWRHGFDFLLVDARGRSFRGDGAHLHDYHCFGIPVLAPVAGQVWRCRDDLPDNVPGELDVGAGRNFGNHVLLRTADGVFVLVAHLQRGSLSVVPGQWVDAGMPVAACGNSGRSTQPHVHLQVQTGEELGAPTRAFHLRNLLVRVPGLPSPSFRLSSRPAEGEIVSAALPDHRLARALHLGPGRTLGFRDELDRLQNLKVEVGLLGDFRISAENGASAAFEETAWVQAFYDKKGRSALLDSWVLAMGLTPFSAAACRWEDAPPVELAPLSLGQSLLVKIARPFGASFRSSYVRGWEAAAGAWRQTGRHRLSLLPGLQITIVSEALIDPDYGCREITITNGGQQSTFRLAEFGAIGDVGVPGRSVSLESESAGALAAPQPAEGATALLA